MKKVLTIISAVAATLIMLTCTANVYALSASFSNELTDYTLELTDVDGDTGAKMCFGSSCQSLDANPTLEFTIFATTSTESVRGPRIKYGIPSGSNKQYVWRELRQEEWGCDSWDFIVKCDFSLMESDMDGYELEDIVIELSSGTSSTSSPAITLTSCVTEPSVHSEFDHAKMCSIIIEEENTDDGGPEEESAPNTDPNPDEGGGTTSGLANLPGMGNNSSGCSLNPAAATNSGGILLILTALAYVVIRRKR
jgi:hypothetical protein